MQPSTGDVLAMVSNPPYDPNALVSTSLSAERLAYFSYTQRDAEGFFPLRPIATGETFAPGSTMKVVTSMAAYNLKPSLAGFNYPVAQCQKFADSNKPLCDEGAARPCGGTMTQCCPSRATRATENSGVQEGVEILEQQADLFGYNNVPPIDLPSQNTLVVWWRRPSERCRRTHRRSWPTTPSVSTGCRPRRCRMQWWRPASPTEAS